MAEIQELDNKIDALVNCRHEQTELRLHAASNGQKMYSHQCLFCGRTAGQYIPHHKIRNKTEIPPYDYELKDNSL